MFNKQEPTWPWIFVFVLVSNSFERSQSSMELTFLKHLSKRDMVVGVALFPISTNSTTSGTSSSNHHLCLIRKGQLQHDVSSSSWSLTPLDKHNSQMHNVEPPSLEQTEEDSYLWPLPHCNHYMILGSNSCAIWNLQVEFNMELFPRLCPYVPFL